METPPAPSEGVTAFPRCALSDGLLPHTHPQEGIQIQKARGARKQVEVIVAQTHGASLEPSVEGSLASASFLAVNDHGDMGVALPPLDVAGEDRDLHHEECSPFNGSE